LYPTLLERKSQVSTKPHLRSLTWKPIERAGEMRAVLSE
jgi:hypothetical protein